MFFRFVFKRSTWFQKFFHKVLGHTVASCSYASYCTYIHNATDAAGIGMMTNIFSFLVQYGPCYECCVVSRQSVDPDNLAQSSLYTQCTLNIINTVPSKSSSHLHNSIHT